MTSEHPSNVSNQEQATKYEKTVQKRRSSIFHSHNSVFCENEDVERPSDQNERESTKATNESETEEFDLRKYVENLRKERRLWIVTWRQRKAERKSLSAKKLGLQNRGQPLDLKYLSDSERAFVRARPNYEEICLKRTELFGVAIKVATLNQLTRKLNQKFISQMEEKLYDATKRIIKISES